MIVYFADRQLNIIGQASSKLPSGLTITDDLKTEDIETGVAVFECVIPYDKQTRALVEECTEVGNYILRSHDSDNEFYTIIDAEKDTKKQEIRIYAEDDGMDLLNEVVGVYEADQAYPITHYINKYATGAGFEIGINEATDLTRKLSWDGESTAAERIASIATQFGGCEVSYSFDIDGLVVTRKYINIYRKRGKDVGITLRLNQDVDSIVTTKSIANLATALQCTGGTPDDENYEDDVEPQPITLKGYKYDDGDFYVDGAVLKSRKALERWSRYLWKTDDTQKSGGHITKQFSYDTISQSELCSRAITELKKICDMEINYEVEITKFPENVKIGDRVNIVDDESKLYVSARVLRLETSVVNQECKATLGEYLIKTSGISQKVADLAAQFAKTSHSAARALEIAKTAREAAESAKEQVDDAVKSVEDAQRELEEVAEVVAAARESAAKAQAAADNAQALVDNVESDIEALETTVANAQAAAAQAQQAARTADAKAVEAAQAAINAQTRADEAEAEATAAQETAETATEKADNAKTTADQAVADAEAAATTAAAAKLDAEQANRDIAALGEELTTVSNTMKADYARKTELTETQAHLQSQISQNAGLISSTVSMLSTIDETANDAESLVEKAQAKAQVAREQATQAAADAVKTQVAADNAAQAAASAQAEADTARVAANTAQTVLNNAQIALDTARAELENIQSRADATEEEIKAAQQAVETAQVAVNNAKVNADTAAQAAAKAQETADNAANNALEAQAVANAAASYAKIAQSVANESENAADAQQAADEAADIAMEAQRTAATAVQNAETAQAAADNAATVAANAQAAANNADEKAQQAATDLATAKQNLANVESKVDATQEEVEAAQAAVNAAQAAADKAQAEAETAQSTADKAKADAETAQAAADMAQAAADDAQKAADEAQAAADKAQADVDSLAVRVTTAETTIKQTSEYIELLATKTEVAETLGGYYTKEETDAAIKVESNAITSSVSRTYATKGNLAEHIKYSNDGRTFTGNMILAEPEDWLSGYPRNREIADDTKIYLPTMIPVTAGNRYIISAQNDTLRIGMSTYVTEDETSFISFSYMGNVGDWTYFAPTGVSYIRLVFLPQTDAITLTYEDYQEMLTSGALKPLMYLSGTELGKETGSYIGVLSGEGDSSDFDAYTWKKFTGDVDKAVEDAQLSANQANNTANTANERISTAESLIQQLSNSIAMLVTDENGESLMTQSENGWTFSMAETSEAVSSLAAGLEALQQETGNTQSTVETLQQAISDHGATLEYVNVTTYEDEPCIELGESDSDFKLLITNTRIMFRHGSNTPTYIDTNGLVTQNIEVKGEIIQGGFVQLITADGGWGLLWKGAIS